MKIRFGLFLLISALFPLLSAADWQSCRLPETILNSLKSVENDRFQSANSIILADDEKLTYQSDGTGTEAEQWAIKICTEAGLKKMRTQTFGYNRFYKKFAFKKCVVYRKNGDSWQSRDIDIAANSRDMADPASLKHNICEPDHRKLTLSIPDLQIGDILYLESFTENIHPRMAGVWSKIQLLQSSEVPVVDYRLTIDAPAEKPLKSIRLRDEVKGTFQREVEEQKNDRIIYRFKIQNVPMLVKEPAMPPVYLSCQRLCLSTLSRWEEVSDWYYQLCLPHLKKVSPEMREKVKELTADSKSDEEKVRAIFNFVSQKIRYMGLVAESVSPGYEPHDVDMTFANRYGVCRDKAALLAAMLDLADLKAFPVLFMSGSEKDPDVPDCFFNHAIVAWDRGNFDYVLMDPTNEATVDFQPAYNSDCSFIVARAGGDRLRNAPVPPAENNSCDFDVDASIGADGNYSGKCTITFKGFYDTVFRNVLSRRLGKARQNFFSSLLRKALPGATLGKVTVTPENMQDTREKLKIVLTFSRPNSVPENQNILALPMPEFGLNFSLMEQVIGDLSLSNRLYPLRNSSSFCWSEKLNIKLPDTLGTGSLPTDKEQKIEGFWEYRRNFEAKENRIVRNKFFASRLMTVPPENYVDFRKFIHDVDLDRSAIPVLKYIIPDGDHPNLHRIFPDDTALILEDSYDLTIIDAKSYRLDRRIRKKILNYAGVKKHSELKITYDPATTAVSVTGKVILPDGRTKELSDREINIVDAPGNDKAPRYPGNKIMVVNFPGVAVDAVVEAFIHMDRRDVQAMNFYFPLNGNDPGCRFLTLGVPADIVLKADATGMGVSFKQKYGQDKNTYFWERHSNRSSATEKYQPLPQFWAPGAAISAVNYRALGNDLKTHLLAAASGTGDLFAGVCRDLALSGKDAKLDKITRIRNFVSRNIRTAGPDLVHQLYSTYSTPETVLKDGYGTSCDKAILIYALLNAAGIEAEFVPVSDCGYTQEALRFLHRMPMHIFTKMLVFIPDDGIYLNDTSHYARLGCVKSQDKIGLSLKNAELISIRPADGSENRRERQYTIALKLDGSAKIGVRTLYYGNAYESAKMTMAEKSPEEKTQLFDKYANSLIRGGEISGKIKSNFEKYPGVIEYSVEAKNAAGFSGKYLIFDLPDLPDVDIFAGADAGSGRRTPIAFNESVESKVVYDIAPPPGYTLVSRQQGNRNIQIGMLNILSDVVYDDDNIYMRRRLMRYPEIAAPSAARQLLFWKNYFNNPEYRRLIFAPVSKGERQ